MPPARGGSEAPAFFAAAADLLAGRPAEVFCQARDALSHDVRECRGLTLTACLAPDAQHLPRGALQWLQVGVACGPPAIWRRIRRARHFRRPRRQQQTQRRRRHRHLGLQT